MNKKIKIATKLCFNLYWKKLLRKRELLIQELFCILIDGKTVELCSDRWLPTQTITVKKIEQIYSPENCCTIIWNKRNAPQYKLQEHTVYEITNTVKGKVIIVRAEDLTI